MPIDMPRMKNNPYPVFSSVVDSSRSGRGNCTLIGGAFTAFFLYSSESIEIRGWNEKGRNPVKKRVGSSRVDTIYVRGNS